MSEPTGLERAEPRPLPDAITALIGHQIPEAIVRAVLNTEFRKMPPEQVARILHKCATSGLDPLKQHVIQFKPKKPDDPWPKPFVTAEGRISIATRHPMFSGLRFLPPRIVDGYVTVDVYVNRKDWKEPLGPVSGTAAVQIKPRNGSPFDDENALAKARTRAVRTALRYAFGDELPDPDAFDTPELMRSDQRRDLFAIAHQQGWDRERRHKEAARVLERPVDTWSALTTLDAARLQAAWTPLRGEIVDVDLDTGEILEASPADAGTLPEQRDSDVSAGETQQATEDPRDTPPPSDWEAASTPPVSRADAGAPESPASTSAASEAVPVRDEPPTPPPSPEPADERADHARAIRAALDARFGEGWSVDRSHWVNTTLRELGAPAATSAADLTLEQLRGMRLYAEAAAEEQQEVDQ